MFSWVPSFVLLNARCPPAAKTDSKAMQIAEIISLAIIKLFIVKWFWLQSLLAENYRTTSSKYTLKSNMSIGFWDYIRIFYELLFLLPVSNRIMRRFTDGCRLPLEELNRYAVAPANFLFLG
jgi:hypothetical protein